MNRREMALGALAGLSAAAWLPARAQAKAVRVLVGFPPGGSSDVLARVLSEALRDKLDGPVIVENKPGAAGRLAVELLKSADADGLTLLLTPNVVATLYPHTYTRLRYDAEKDIQPIARLATFPLVVGVGPKVPASVRTVPELMAWMKADPSNAFYGSSAQGSTPHFVGQMLGKAAGVSLTHVAYKGDAPAVQDLLAGQVAMSVNPPAAQLPHLASGRLRILAVTGAQRMKQLPEVPTLLESGYAIQTADWFGVFAPAGINERTVQRLEAAIKEAMSSASAREGLEKLYLSEGFLPAAALAQNIRKESAFWAPVVKASGFSIDE